MNIKEIPIKIVLTILLFSCLFNLPYGYYQLVRFLGFLGFSVLAYHAHKKDSQIASFIFIGLALLFQPFFKVVLGRQIWSLVDIIVGLGLLISILAKPKK
ncbi:DUF6804 family protein [Belliella kenyensis]|uniref:DUF6804 family protein n=1 Tax=Belliella kenyensis TaxID=1472724 RepID=A0ABV8EQN7_9BACT|nr:DUF6804 family protein [Belliella kenyensis]MCH7402896.1 hypothetical protein [Belliella kenyensis]MDN3602602.1 hypothetical protein [Belliella kenyensis]